MLTYRFFGGANLKDIINAKFVVIACISTPRTDLCSASNELDKGGCASAAGCSCDDPPHTSVSTSSHQSFCSSLSLESPSEKAIL